MHPVISMKEQIRYVYRRCKYLLDTDCIYGASIYDCIYFAGGLQGNWHYESNWSEGCGNQRCLPDQVSGNCCFIFQQMYMLKNLSIYDNIILPAYRSKKGKGKEKRAIINNRAKELMKKLGISEIAENDINEVSGGQLQRACICRSLINQPKMIFADEPTGALNQQNSKEVMKELNRINAEGTTVMLVTHDMKVAAKSDRVLYIEDGNIKGELSFGKMKEQSEIKERERKIFNWLMEMGF